MLWLYYDYRARNFANTQIALERGETVLESLTAGLRGNTRMGRYRPDFLTGIFAELAESQSVAGVRLADESGTVVAEGGNQNFPDIQPGGAPAWQDEQLVVARAIVFEGHGPGPGGGRGRMRGASMDADSVPWGAGQYVLTVAVDTAWLNAARERERRQFLIASAVWLGLVCPLILAMLRARERHRRLTTELIVAEVRAHRQEELARIGAGLAHETKNPLGIVRGLAQSIRDTSGLPPETKRMARDIVDEADRTVGQINSFLDLARPKDPALGAVHVDALFASLVPLLEAEGSTKRIAFRIDKIGTRIRADEDQLRRCILNLAINAVRAIDVEGTVTLGGHQDGDAVTLTVSDTGQGIALEDIARVTEPYFSRFEGGTGLGLAIVDHIVRAHGWTLRIDSTPGEGTQVSIHGVPALG
jgi:signal transduction histidine kinase